MRSSKNNPTWYCKFCGVAVAAVMLVSLLSNALGAPTPTWFLIMISALFFQAMSEGQDLKGLPSLADLIPFISAGRAKGCEVDQKEKTAKLL